MDSNCNIITEILLVISYTTAKSYIITVTKLLVTSYCPTMIMQLNNHCDRSNRCSDYLNYSGMLTVFIFVNCLKEMCRVQEEGIKWASEAKETFQCGAFSPSKKVIFKINVFHSSNLLTYLLTYRLRDLLI